ncbi:lipocalin family protein [Myroides sp. N17-2]|uniref:lipocalin family protein n=1 Tax=Myroides sp. N17-2 TaxID=2030799 RepID=UPI000EFD6DA2|nr:lipocalin family protein [Myroides sp. N17-2]
MKKLYLFLISILCLAIFSSCSSNDDISQSQYNLKLQNTEWELTNIEINKESKNPAAICPEKIIFKTDNVTFDFSSADIKEWDNNTGCIPRKGFSNTYKIKKNKLILIDSDSEHEIISLTKNKLILKNSLHIFISTGSGESIDTEVLKTYKLIKREIH